MLPVQGSSLTLTFQWLCMCSLYVHVNCIKKLSEFHKRPSSSSSSCSSINRRGGSSMLSFVPLVLNSITRQVSNAKDEKPGWDPNNAALEDSNLLSWCQTDQRLFFQHRTSFCFSRGHSPGRKEKHLKMSQTEPRDRGHQEKLPRCESIHRAYGFTDLLCSHFGFTEYFKHHYGKNKWSVINIVMTEHQNMSYLGV